MSNMTFGFAKLFNAVIVGIGLVTVMAMVKDKRLIAACIAGIIVLINVICIFFG